MTWADITIITILLVSCLIGVMRGFIKESLMAARWVAAFIIALLFSPSLATLFTRLIDSPSLRQLTAFFLLFIATILLAAMVTKLVGEVVKKTGLSGTDRLLGVAFGLVRGTVIVMLVLLLAPSVVAIDQERWWQESVLIPHFLSLEGWCRYAASSITDFVTSFFK